MRCLATDAWRDNLGEKRATIWMRFFGRGDEIIVAERRYGKRIFRDVIFD
jgi:hypothetical protein